jgi:glycosyltransferase involved in cell wall biosynthesis
MGAASALYRSRLSGPGTADAFEYYCRLSRWRQRAHRWSPDRQAVHWFHEPFFPFDVAADCVLGFGPRVPFWKSPAKAVVLFDLFSMLEDAHAWSVSDFRNRKMRQYRLLAERCDIIFAISGQTKTDFLNHFDYPENRVRVVYGGVEPSFHPDQKRQAGRLCRERSLPSDFLLYAGALSTRKNIARLIRAYSLSKASSIYPLVLTGNLAKMPADALDEISRCGVGEKLHFIGHIPDQDMPVLFASAKAFLFPTLYEGLGLPILEAMASGTPTVIGNVGAAPEIGQGYAVMVDPLNPAEIADGIDHALLLSQDALDSARRHACGFSWENCAAHIRAGCEWAVQNKRQ